MNKESWLELLEKVKNGAALYLSTDAGFVSPFVEPFDLDVVVNSSRIGPASFVSKNMKDTLNFGMAAPWKMVLNPGPRVVVLAKETDGNPIFTETKYGNGKLYFLSVPLEMNLTQTPGAFDRKQPGYYKIYQQIAQPIINSRVLRQTNPDIGVTEHVLNNDEQVVVLINYSPEAGTASFQLKEGWEITGSLYGKLPAGNNLTINANDALVLLVKNKPQPSHGN
jgi:beta-galactosidase